MSQPFWNKLTNIDIYRIHNKRKKTYKNIWFMLNDLYNKIKFDWWIKHSIELWVSKIWLAYKIDTRTIKRYLKPFIYKEWNRSKLILNEFDLYTIEKAIEISTQYEIQKEKHKKIIKYIIYSKIWTIQK